MHDGALEVDLALRKDEAAAREQCFLVRPAAGVPFGSAHFVEDLCREWDEGARADFDEGLVRAWLSAYAWEAVMRSVACRCDDAEAGVLVDGAHGLDEALLQLAVFQD